MRETLKSKQDLFVEPSAAFVTADPIAAYKHFLPRARAIAADTITPCPADLAPARHAVERGLTAIEPHLEAVQARLPRLSIATLFELRPLMIGLCFAVDRVACTPEGVMEGHVARLRFMRTLALRQLEVLAYLDLVPEARVKAIRVGPGSIDACREAIAIVAVYSDFAVELAGKHPFTAAQLDQLRERGHWLLGALRSQSGAVTSGWREPATVIRDRFWTLLNGIHDELREAGAAIFGLKHLDDHVPPLGRAAAASEPQSGAPPRSATG